LPFIDWQRNRINRDIVQTQYLEAVVGFRDALYQALVDVETTLAARQKLSQATRAASEDLALAERQEKLASLRYQTGATAQQLWLDEQERYRGVALTRSRQRVAELDNLVALYKALGVLL
jgi:outer membrane protein TolC